MPNTTCASVHLTYAFVNPCRTSSMTTSRRTWLGSGRPRRCCWCQMMHPAPWTIKNFHGFHGIDSVCFARHCEEHLNRIIRCNLPQLNQLEFYHPNVDQDRLSPNSSFFPRASERRVLPIVGVCKASSHLHIFSSSHLLILTSSHLYIFTSSHLYICSSSHLLISSHLYILLSSHLLIFASSHPHIFSSLHLLIFTPSYLTSFHLHIFSSLHLLIFTPSYLTSSHLHIFTSSHLHILSSSHPHIFSSSHLMISHPHIFTSSSSPLLLFFLSWRRGQGQCQRDGTKRNPFARNEVRSPKAEVKLRFQVVRRNPFARNEFRSPKAEVKLRFQVVRRNPFARNEVRSPKTEVKLRCPSRPAQRFRTKHGSSSIPGLWWPWRRSWGFADLVSFSSGNPCNRWLGITKLKLARTIYLGRTPLWL